MWTILYSCPGNFYPRSPCGERLEGDQFFYYADKFLSTLSLRRATPSIQVQHLPKSISIHALLAESDSPARVAPTASRNFYPRSPCGERLIKKEQKTLHAAYFYPRSPCGERHSASYSYRSGHPISIHALLAESDHIGKARIERIDRFLSTLSLRRATRVLEVTRNAQTDFYPRSPCGERLDYYAV